ncbi:pentapeptide repeat-containing protein [Actinoplanes oblitus]|uniref:Pentapeptide repeat-containing protein n=1 Tax=Actinoplanes oblitus TaxID=3040509 RepID=A0ABY8WPW2_9ACTN|nr:pentapeptide repeat-containing protein [Actinoplanes oblitus]WIM98354.1 pentapeptide repeat-containing protein [Actinoplanes oblitus]
MRTTMRLAVAGGGLLAALAMTAGPAQAQPPGDPDGVKAGCETFNRVGARFGLWDHYDCSSWRADQHDSVTVVRHSRNGARTTSHTTVRTGTGVDFTGWPFTGADFTGGPFTGADFTGWPFSGTDFTGGPFGGGDFTGWPFSGLRGHLPTAAELPRVMNFNGPDGAITIPVGRPAAPPKAAHD